MEIRNDVRQFVAEGLDLVGKGAVEDHDASVGVVKEIGQLVVAVAVVGVDRDVTGGHGGGEGQEVLGAVIEVGRHGALTGESQLVKEGAERFEGLDELPPGVDGVTRFDGTGQGLLVGHRTPHIYIRPIAHLPPLRDPPR